MREKKSTRENELFNKWFSNLPKEQRAGIAMIIADKCDVSLTYVESWRYNKYIRPVYKKLINQVAREDIFAPETVKDENY